MAGDKKGESRVIASDRLELPDTQLQTRSSINEGAATMTSRSGMDRSGRTLGGSEDYSSDADESPDLDYYEVMADSDFNDSDDEALDDTMFDDPMLDQVRLLNDFLEEAENQLYVNVGLQPRSGRQKNS
jgi:hypothetical protein